MNRNQPKSFSISGRIKSFAYAFKGLKILLLHEHNSRIHLLAATLAVIMGFIFKISTLEWVSICLSIALVLAFEIVNTAIENLCNLISQEKNEAIRRIKDLSAAAVLVVALFTLIVGLIIFLPKVISIC